MVTLSKMVNRPSGLVTCLVRASALNTSSRDTSVLDVLLATTVVTEFMRSRLFVLVGLASWWLSGVACAEAIAKIAKLEPAKPVILVVGDSLSAGYGIDIKQGWVVLLAQRLEQRLQRESQGSQAYGYRVVNASVSGETSGGARGRLPKLLELHHPAILILEIGANDGLRGLPIQQIKDNLTTILTQAKAAGARVLMVGMQMPPNYGERYTQEFSAVFANVAREQHAALVPFFLDGVAIDMKLVQADGLHPTAAAQPRLLDNVWQKLEPMLRQPVLRKKK
jgi:acyl-CoA thioesterase I